MEEYSRAISQEGPKVRISLCSRKNAVRWQELQDAGREIKEDPDDIRELSKIKKFVFYIHCHWMSSKASLGICI